MTIKVGDKLPNVDLMMMTDKGPSKVSTADLFGGKKVALFAVPGAYTPTCSAKHLPGFVDNMANLNSKGVSDIVCLSVNDPFVMAAWGKDHNAGSIKMVADPDAAFTKAMGVEFDASGAGLGVRSRGLLPEFFHADVGKFVGFFISGVTGMAFDPFPANLML